MFSGNDGYAEVEIIINTDFTWHIVLEGRVKSTDNLDWADIPNHIKTVASLENLLSVIQSSRICKGCPFEPFEAVVPLDNSQPVFYTKKQRSSSLC